MKSILQLAFLIVACARLTELSAAQDAAFVETKVKTITVDPYSQSPWSSGNVTDKSYCRSGSTSPKQEPSPWS
jgi:hypothetical protein